jgi:hypothetical protein
MTRLMVLGGGNLERAPIANIVMSFQELRAEMHWLVVGLSYPVDLAVLRGGASRSMILMPLDLPGPVTWTPMPQV